MKQTSPSRTSYIATFYSHFGAIRFKKLCASQGWPARAMPVPRDLSSSCGTCVRYESGTPWPSGAVSDEIEQIVRLTPAGYEHLYRAQNS